MGRRASLAEALALTLFEAWVYFSVERRDILIEREAVGGVIPVLESHQPLVVDSVGSSHPLSRVGFLGTER